MTDQRPRRFTIADIMIFVAAAAVGLMVQRSVRSELDSVSPRPLPFAAIQRWSTEATPLLMACSIAVLVSRALPPRPRSRLLFRQPGTIACLAAVTRVVSNELFLLIKIMPIKHSITITNHVYIILYCGHSVALAWGVMALVGAWKPEASWIDRAGRCLGIIYIIIYVVMQITFG